MKIYAEAKVCLVCQHEAHARGLNPQWSSLLYLSLLFSSDSLADAGRERNLYWFSDNATWYWKETGEWIVWVGENGTKTRLRELKGIEFQLCTIACDSTSNDFGFCAIRQTFLPLLVIFFCVNTTRNLSAWMSNDLIIRDRVKCRLVSVTLKCDVPSIVQFCFIGIFHIPRAAQLCNLKKSC